MPLYDFLCIKCDHEFEMHRPVDSGLPACPQCEDTNVKKLPSALTFTVRGFNAANHYGLKGGKK
jgi:putative FmdB family regulatory protein